MRRQVDGVVRLLRADGAPQRKSAGNGRRGRPFRFNAGQVAGLRKQVERGTAVPGLAKTHKFTAATIYAALKRAGWRRRK